MGWRGSAIHWQRYKMTYLLLAGLAAPLVLSVHSVVSFDFAVAILPGWHSTIFPPFFVAGAIYSGFAMVLNIIIPVRKIYGLQDFITDRTSQQHGERHAHRRVDRRLTVYRRGVLRVVQRRHLRAVSGVQPRVRALRLVVLAIDPDEHPRPAGALVAHPHERPSLLFFVALFVNVGMWLERFVIVIVSLHRDFTPVALGDVLRRRSGTGRSFSAPSGCSSRCCSSSSVSCR